MKLKLQRSYKPDNEYIRLQLAQQNIQWTLNMRDHLLRITSSFADVTGVWNLLWTATSVSRLRASSWRRQYLITTGAGCWRNMFLSSTKEWSGKKQMRSWLKVTSCGYSRTSHPEASGLLGRLWKHTEVQTGQPGASTSRRLQEWYKDQQ